MIPLNTQEKTLLAKAINKNIFPDINNISELKISEGRLLTGGYAEVIVSPSVHSNYYFAKRSLRYERFNLADYKTKRAAEFFFVPAIRAANPQELVNYMNEVYLHSVNVRDRNPVYDIFRGFQLTLKLENLKDFIMIDPVVDSVRTIEAREGSFIFTGLVKIKFT